MVSVRTLTAVLLLSTLAGCGGAPTQPAAVATPQFVVPTTTAAPPNSAPPSVTPKATAASATAAPSSAAPKPATTGKPVKRSKQTFVFPVAASNVAWHTTHSKYPATDIFADCGEPIVAVTNGVILEVSRVDRYVKGRPDGPYNGGLSVSLLGDDGVRYGSHFSAIKSGIRAGVRVTAGQRLGSVGHTGNANGVCHLHFGLSPKCAGTGDWKVRRGVVWPYSFLASWRKKGSKSPVAAVAAWEKVHHCKA